MRIAIVDDRPLAVEAIRRIVTSVVEYRVAWVANSGEEAIVKAQADKPDLILLDMVMPGINGAETTRRLKKLSPCPILIVTASVSGNYSLVYEALNAGAVDAVPVPTLGLSGDLRGGDVLLTKIAQIQRKIKPGSSTTLRPILVAPPAIPPIIAIGASTDGPNTVGELLANLPRDLKAGILITIHIAAEFATSLAQQLSQRSPVPVRVAAESDRLSGGLALLAGKNDHLIFKADGTVGYTKHPAETPYRPNVDALFESLAANVPKPGIAVLLTGMGRDGAEGLLKLRKLGWTTFAQDEASSVVEGGMHAAAVKLGAASFVLPPAQIGKMIQTHLRVPTS
jgi:two-component system, chemotaxis family, response regulator WspF